LLISIKTRYFTAVARAFNGNTYLFSKTGDLVTFKDFDNDYLNSLFKNQHIDWNYKALGKSYNSALRLKVFDLLVLDKDLVVVQAPIDLKVKPYEPLDNSTISQLAQLDSSTRKHVLYSDFQKSSILASRHLSEEDFSLPNVRDFIEERFYLQAKMQDDSVSSKIKIEAAEKALEDYAQTNTKNK